MAKVPFADDALLIDDGVADPDTFTYLTAPAS